MDARSQPPPRSSPAGSKPDVVDVAADAEARFREARRRRLALLAGLALAAVVVGWVIRSQAPATILAHWHASNAQAKLEEDDLDGALAACDRALALLPEEAGLYELRAQIRQERSERPEALEDLNQLLKLNPHFPQGYLQRSFVQQLLGNHEASISDARKARDWWGSDDPRALNNLAYALAVANRDLDAALADAEQALKLLNTKRQASPDEKAKSSPSASAGGASGVAPSGTSSDTAPADAAAEPAQASDLALSSYLDTRGFIRFRLAQQAKSSDSQQAKTRHQAALADFDEAIRLFSRSKKAALERPKAQASSTQVREERRLNEGLGLMHHHRSQVHEALGDKEKASADREFASRLGYDPAKHGL